MPLYEYLVNAENKITINEEISSYITMGKDETIRDILGFVKKTNEESGRPCLFAFDGNYGVNWNEIIGSMQEAMINAGLAIEFICINTVFLSYDEIKKYKKTYITDDPGFGYENDKGRMQEIMDTDKISALKETLEYNRTRSSSEISGVMVYGPGASIEEIEHMYDLRFYFETSIDNIMWQMWQGELVPLGMNTPDSDYFWKELYYNDFHMLNNQKWHVLEHMDYFIESFEINNLQMLSRETYDEIITTLLKYPIKQISVFMPGPWGAYRFKDLWEVKGLENSAWNNIASPKLDLAVELANGKQIRLPSINLLQYGDRLVGSYWDREVPKWWPLIAAIDDGYFPDDDTPLERTAMPIHNHPSTDYVRRNFNEQFGRYETYYIVEAYEGASTLMGFREGVDLEEWEKKCREADKDKSLIKDWRDYINVWETRAGDLFLIPPGTSHGHGGRQMVLELDTTVNTTTCEYSFFMHDYGRNTWDNDKKSMTGKPMKLHCEHGFNMEKWRREKWVNDHLRAKPVVVKWTREYSLERYTTLPEMPFHIERFHFKKSAQNDTEGKFMQVVTLTVGDKVIVRSKDYPSRQTTINWLQSAIIPASFGEYEFINPGEGQCTVVQIRMKKG